MAVTTKKGGKSTCAGCGLKFDTDIMVTVNKKKYCPTCGEKAKKDAESYKALIDYIWVDLGVKQIEDFNMGMLTTFIKQIKDKYDIGNRQILFTLQYMYEYEDEHNKPPPFLHENDIYSVIRYYQRSKEFWSSVKKLKTDQEKIEEALSLPQKKIIISRSTLNALYEEDEQKRRSLYHQEELDVDDIEDDGLEGEGDQAWSFVSHSSPSEHIYQEEPETEDVSGYIGIEDILADIEEEEGDLI